MQRYGINRSLQGLRHGPECVGVKLDAPGQGVKNSLLRKGLAHLSIT
jgi:hypothetical protein